MTWVRLDENFYQHPKVVSAGPLGMAMHVAALCYCNKFLTDGFIPHAIVPTLLNLDGFQQTWRDVAGLLVDCGLWEHADGGYQIHDYHDYQPSRQKVLEEREKKREAGRKGGQASAQARAKANAQAATEADTQAKSKPVSDPDTVPHKDLDDDDHDNARAREDDEGPRQTCTWVSEFERVTGKLIDSLTYQRFAAYADDLGDDVVAEALRRSELAENPAKYADGILQRWKREGVRSLADVARLDAAFERSKQARSAKDGQAREPPRPRTVDEIQREKRERGEYVEDEEAVAKLRVLAGLIGRMPDE